MLSFGAVAAPPTPPRQPAHGPGGADYAHAAVRVRAIAGGAAGAWLFTPADPVPSSAPVVVFCHGWGAMNPRAYRAWIDHLVRRGNVVIYPNYQDSLRTPPDRFLANAVDGVRAALAELDGRRAPSTERDHVAVVGHSAGGVLAAELGATAASNDLPPMRAVMPVEPGDGSGAGRHRATVPVAPLATMPAATLLLVVVGADDHRAGEALGLRVYDDAVRVPRANKNVVELRSDDHGEPTLIANHSAPSATPDGGRTRLVALAGGDFRHAGAVDALDWYGTWKLFDALCDAAFHGRHRDVALCGSPAQLAMGAWSDGVPVAPMRLLR